MPDQEMRIEENTSEVDTDFDAVAAIKELKENSVDKAQYNKLKEENAKLLKSLINGETINQEKPAKEIDVKGIEKILSTENNMVKNIQGFQMMLDLREADLAAGKPDPFIPLTNRNPSQEDLDMAADRAAIYQECIDYAAGDNALFTQELTRRMIDIQLPKRKK